MITESLKTKIHFFLRMFMRKKDRLALNFGHTFAHAIEMATQNLFKRNI